MIPRPSRPPWQACTSPVWSWPVTTPTRSSSRTGVITATGSWRTCWDVPRPRRPHSAQSWIPEYFSRTHAGKHTTRRNGQARVARKATRLHLSKLRNLRRSGLGVGLRATRRRAQEEPQGRMVARDGAPARRHRGAGRRDSHASARLGGQWARRWIHGSARGLPHVQGSLSRRQAAGCALSPETEQASGRGGAVPAHRAAAVQSDVQDLHGTRGGERGHGVPPSGDGAGHLRQLPERAAEHPPEGAVRNRNDRQTVPKRDHARKLHLPHARVRADGDAILRRPWNGHGGVPVLEGGKNAVALGPRPVIPAT